jgi:hypothetical protein
MGSSHSCYVYCSKGHGTFLRFDGREEDCTICPHRRRVNGALKYYGPVECPDCQAEEEAQKELQRKQKAERIRIESEKKRLIEAEKQRIAKELLKKQQQEEEIKRQKQLEKQKLEDELKKFEKKTQLQKEALNNMFNNNNNNKFENPNIKFNMEFPGVTLKANINPMFNSLKDVANMVKRSAIEGEAIKEMTNKVSSYLKQDIFKNTKFQSEKVNQHLQQYTKYGEDCDNLTNVFKEQVMNKMDDHKQQLEDLKDCDDQTKQEYLKNMLESMSSSMNKTKQALYTIKKNHESMINDYKQLHNYIDDINNRNIKIPSEITNLISTIENDRRIIPNLYKKEYETVKIGEVWSSTQIADHSERVLRSTAIGTSVGGAIGSIAGGFTGLLVGGLVGGVVGYILGGPIESRQYVKQSSTYDVKEKSQKPVEIDGKHRDLLNTFAKEMQLELQNQIKNNENETNRKKQQCNDEINQWKEKLDQLEKLNAKVNNAENLLKALQYKMDSANSRDFNDIIKSSYILIGEIASLQK